MGRHKEEKEGTGKIKSPGHEVEGPAPIKLPNCTPSIRKNWGGEEKVHEREKGKEGPLKGKHNPGKLDNRLNNPTKNRHQKKRRGCTGDTSHRGIRDWRVGGNRCIERLLQNPREEESQCFLCYSYLHKGKGGQIRKKQFTLLLLLAIQSITYEG